MSAISSSRAPQRENHGLGAIVPVLENASRRIGQGLDQPSVAGALSPDDIEARRRFPLVGGFEEGVPAAFVQGMAPLIGPERRPTLGLSYDTHVSQRINAGLSNFFVRSAGLRLYRPREASEQGFARFLALFDLEHVTLLGVNQLLVDGEFIQPMRKGPQNSVVVFDEESCRFLDLSSTTKGPLGKGVDRLDGKFRIFAPGQSAAYRFLTFGIRIEAATQTSWSGDIAIAARAYHGELHIGRRTYQPRPYGAHEPWFASLHAICLGYSYPGLIHNEILESELWRGESIERKFHHSVGGQYNIFTIFGYTYNQWLFQSEAYWLSTQSHKGRLTTKLQVKERSIARASSELSTQIPLPNVTLDLSRYLRRGSTPSTQFLVEREWWVGGSISFSQRQSTDQRQITHTLSRMTRKFTKINQVHKALAREKTIRRGMSVDFPVQADQILRQAIESSIDGSDFKSQHFPIQVVDRKYTATQHIHLPAFISRYMSAASNPGQMDTLTCATKLMVTKENASGIKATKDDPSAVRLGFFQSAAQHMADFLHALLVRMGLIDDCRKLFLPRQKTDLLTWKSESARWTQWFHDRSVQAGLIEDFSNRFSVRAPEPTSSTNSQIALEAEHQGNRFLTDGIIGRVRVQMVQDFTNSNSAEYFTLKMSLRVPRHLPWQQASAREAITHFEQIVYELLGVSPKQTRSDSFLDHGFSVGQTVKVALISQHTELIRRCLARSLPNEIQYAECASVPPIEGWDHQSPMPICARYGIQVSALKSLHVFCDDSEEQALDPQQKMEQSLKLRHGLELFLGARSAFQVANSNPSIQKKLAPLSRDTAQRMLQVAALKELIERGAAMEHRTGTSPLSTFQFTEIQNIASCVESLTVKARKIQAADNPTIEGRSEETTRLLYDCIWQPLRWELLRFFEEDIFEPQTEPQRQTNSRLLKARTSQSESDSAYPTHASFAFACKAAVGLGLTPYSPLRNELLYRPEEATDSETYSHLCCLALTTLRVTRRTLLSSCRNLSDRDSQSKIERFIGDDSGLALCLALSYFLPEHDIISSDSNEGPLNAAFFSKLTEMFDRQSCEDPTLSPIGFKEQVACLLLLIRGGSEGYEPFQSEANEWQNEDDIRKQAESKEDVRKAKNREDQKRWAKYAPNGIETPFWCQQVFEDDYLKQISRRRRLHRQGVTRSQDNIKRDHVGKQEP